MSPILQKLNQSYEVKFWQLVYSLARGDFFPIAGVPNQESLRFSSCLSASAVKKYRTFLGSIFNWRASLKTFVFFTSTLSLPKEKSGRSF